MNEFNDFSLIALNLSSISITLFFQFTVLFLVQFHFSIDKFAMTEVITFFSQLSVHSHFEAKKISMTEFEKKQEFDRFMRNLSLIRNEQQSLANQKNTKTTKKNQKKSQKNTKTARKNQKKSVKTVEKKKRIDKKTMSQKRNKNKNFEKNFEKDEKVFEKVSRYTKKTLRKFKNQVMKIKKRFAAKILDSKKIKKRQRKSATKQKKDYENITKNVFMKKRLSDRNLLTLRKNTSLIAKKRWIQALYAWSFKRVLLKSYFSLIFKKEEDEFVWSDRRLKSFDQQDFAYFRDRIRKSNLFRAKEEMRKRRVKQLKSKKNSLTGKFQKAAETSENVQISDEARTILIYNILSIKTNTSRIRMKQVRKCKGLGHQRCIAGDNIIPRLITAELTALQTLSYIIVLPIE